MSEFKRIAAYFRGENMLRIKGCFGYQGRPAAALRPTLS